MKKNNLWISYILIILILLAVILFVLPDKFFLKKEDNKGFNPNNTNVTSEFPFKEYKSMIEEITNSNYSYTFDILVGSKEYIYEGNKTDNGFIGVFKDEEKVSEYTELNDYIKADLVDLNNLFKLLENETYEENKYDNARMFVYNINVDGLYTEVSVYTDLYLINKIVIANKEFQYSLSYSNIINK